MKNFDSVQSSNGQKPPLVYVSDKPPQNQRVNLLTAKQTTGPKKIFKKILALIVIVIITLGAVVLIRAANISEKIFVGQKTTFFGKFLDLIRGGGDNDRLIGEDLGQINILLLGIGGENHDGPYLTDTMILAQIRPDIGAVSLTSIPRDYLVNLPENAGQEKINAAFALGLTKNQGPNWDKGGQWARATVEHISGLKVPYFAVVDFSGFEKAVNEVGGLDINVERAFTDSEYPDSGTGYLPPQSFSAGQQHMDGQRSLIFARSRHAPNLEGSDFARSLRQQKILEAFKQKMLNINLIKDASALNNLINIFADHFHTNMTPGGLYRVYNLLKGRSITVSASSLDPETGLICPEILASNGAYVVVPCNSEADVTSFFKNSFAIGKMNAEKSVVWLANSTGNPLVYNTAFRKLTNAGLQVYQLSYTQDNLKDSLVYEANPKPATVEFIKNELYAVSVTLPPPGVTVSKDRVDVIVVLGKSAPVEDAPIPYIAPPARIPTSTAATTSSSTPATSTSTATSTKKSTK